MILCASPVTRPPKELTPWIVTMTGDHGGDALLSAELLTVWDLSAETPGPCPDTAPRRWCDLRHVIKPLWFKFEYRKSRDNSGIFPIRFLWGFKETVNTSGLAECLAHGNTRGAVPHPKQPQQQGNDSEAADVPSEELRFGLAYSSDFQLFPLMAHIN